MFRKLLRGVLSVLLLLVVACTWMFWPVRLSVDELPADLPWPTAQVPDGMSLHALPTGVMHSRAMLAFRGGGPEPRDFSMTAYLVRHPRGDLLIDAGMGSQAARQLSQQSWLLRATTDLQLGEPAAVQLRQAGIDPSSLSGVLLTHAHWDHVSGLTDLPGVPVRVPRVEHDFIGSGHRMAELANSLPDAWRDYSFDGGPYLGYPRSHDVWGDGSIVVVPAGGHTPGSVVIFVSLPDGTRYGFVGDLVWQTEGLQRPAERPWIARALVDLDAAEVRKQIAHLAALQRRFPQLRLVPAHDDRMMRDLPSP
ncbi:MAG: MBL fold metallo-hydrolase [Xanthomonadales bacterium]|nr:MBL fold metallo-hydrolase [Xanthomonadales bacterium]MCB1629063.1 MBL fold metallo-hydrolase [Xanthomonadales bacterium]